MAGIDQEKAEDLLVEQLRLEQEDLEAFHDEMLPHSDVSLRQIFSCPNV